MTMTTPEALRRRQYRLGIIILILGVLTVIWGIVLEVQSHNQRACLQTSLRQLNTAFTVRASLNDQRNEAITAKSSLLDQQVAAQRTLIKAVSTATTQADVVAAFAQFNKTDQELAQESARVTENLTRINDQIKKTKVPDFPEGKCS